MFRRGSGCALTGRRASFSATQRHSHGCWSRRRRSKAFPPEARLQQQRSLFSMVCAPEPLFLWPLPQQADSGRQRLVHGFASAACVMGKGLKKVFSSFNNALCSPWFVHPNPCFCGPSPRPPTHLWLCLFATAGAFDFWAFLEPSSRPEPQQPPWASFLWQTPSILRGPGPGANSTRLGQFPVVCPPTPPPSCPLPNLIF